MPARSAPASTPRSRPTTSPREQGAGLGFAAVALAASVVALTRNPTAVALLGAVSVLAGLIGSYALAITTGVPVLHHTVEPVDGLAVFTKAIEVVGLLAAAHLLWCGRPAVAVSQLQPKGSLT